MNTLIAKQGLTSEQLLMVNAEVERKGKNKMVMYLLWWFTGVVGGHRFYLGDTGYAVAMLLLGWATLFIWPLVDVFFIGKRLEAYNERLELEAIQQVKLQSSAPAQPQNFQAV